MNDEWETPLKLFKAFDDVYHFDLDACASKDNHKCDFYFTKNEDYTSIELPTRNKIWMNPPYSRGNINKCMKKAYDDSLKGHLVVCLVRDDPTTGWYEEFVDNKALVILRLKKRVKFVNGNSGYNFPCCVVIYDNNVTSRILRRGCQQYKRWWVGDTI